ncbi:TIGR04066 family peptide maturation system protein [uncultured Ruminococcus sp.]|uniref:TIGR04066 family peptide maturation system protein n=1 Tax=uncultured Ruminococcus sp. TaxID=165186 RepID=UPI0025F719E4|nr:TIGR04066 family peptide maturation system protein [uncultured Ruminococcus sp.]
MNKERIAIYPFSTECNVFSDFCDMIGENYCLVEAASPLVWGLTDQIIKTSEGEITVRKSPAEFEKEVDTLLIPDFYISEKAESALINEISKYMPKVRKVVYYGGFSNKGKQKLIDIAAELSVDFKDLRDYSNSTEVHFNTIIEDIDIPLIAVAGVWENTNKFETALAINRSLKKQGYKVLQVGSRGYADMFGAVPFPDFMLDPSVSEFDKPLMFSLFLKELVYKEKPDVIIVSIPGATQSLNGIFPNRSGVLQFITFQAMTPDYVVMCSMFETNPDVYTDMVKNLCYYRYGVSVDAISMSGMYFDISYINETHELSTLLATDEQLSTSLQKVTDNELLITDITAEGQGDRIAEDIINKLAAENISI